tara:strand:+ start:309 stop:806 length:498 start_codon:yes stop_codon:yes gene_type:complete
MIKAKKIKNFITIDKQKVSYVSGNKYFRIIEFNYTGKIKIKSLLDENFVIKRNKNKILIINFSNANFSEDLFSYTGKLKIFNCNAYTPSNRVLRLFVNQHELQQWNTFMKSKDEDGDGPIYDSMTINWEDMDFDGNNNKSKRIHRKTIYDKETRTYTTTKEIRKR